MKFGIGEFAQICRQFPSRTAAEGVSNRSGGDAVCARYNVPKVLRVLMRLMADAHAPLLEHSLQGDPRFSETHLPHCHSGD
jgi:hypothetical protein